MSGEQLQLCNDSALADQLIDRAAKLPIEHIDATALMQLAAQRLRAHDQAHTLPGWADWSLVADGWLIKIVERDEGVWLMGCSPVEGARIDHSFGFRAPSDSREAQALRKLRKALRDAP